MSLVLIENRIWHKNNGLSLNMFQKKATRFIKYPFVFSTLLVYSTSRMCVEIGRQKLHPDWCSTGSFEDRGKHQTKHSWYRGQLWAQNHHGPIICTSNAQLTLKWLVISTHVLTSSSSFCVSASICLISSIVSSTHLSIQQKSWRWKLLKILFSCWGTQVEVWVRAGY